MASGFGWAVTASGTTQAENVLSCFWRISLAVSGEEAITVVTDPSFRVMRGPWILASSASDRLGLDPRLRSEPIIGRPVGPGGSFLLDFELRTNGLMKKQQNISDMHKRRMGSSIFVSSILVQGID